MALWKGPAGGVKLYHYTSEDGCYGIKKSQMIQTSTNTKIDATMGEGVYLTTIPPWKSDEDIIYNNWDGGVSNFNRQLSKIDYYIEINSKDLSGLRKNQWGRKELLHPGPINLRRVPHKIRYRGHGKPKNNNDEALMLVTVIGTAVLGVMLALFR